MAVLLTSAAFLAACSKAPTLTTLDPPDGHPHDVIFVQGDDRELAQIVWDAGTPGEKIIPGPFFGAFMFSVPHGAGPGAHNVALQNGAGRSASVTFTVPPTPGLLTVARPPGPATRPFPEPRIDAVTVLGATFDSSSVSVSLYVQGANIDVGATVWVQDPATEMLTEVATVSHKALRNDWFGVSSDQLDYPIYHYSSAIVSLGVRSPGEGITLVVKNLDGTPSRTFAYRLPNDADSLDSDGDGLLDKWETGGYDADSDGVIDVDLKGLGADPNRRDLFLELDIMDGVIYRPERAKDGAYDSTVFDALRAMFESAPIINLGGRPGIRLEIDATEKPCLPDPPRPDKCSWLFTMFDTGASTGSVPDPLTTEKVRFSKLKEHNFKDTIRGRIYHYGIWAIKDDNDSDSGHSDYRDDFLISLDAFGDSYQTRRSQIEALAHEFGHNLGQFHGGATHLPNYKPNYLSVLSYSWALRTGWDDDADRKAYITCLPFYYAVPGAKETNGAVPSDVNLIVDYSEGMARALVRPTFTAGTTNFCGLTVDWTTITSGAKIEDFPNWPDLKFDGLHKGGGIP